jgi:hypothetical protein
MSILFSWRTAVTLVRLLFEPIEGLMEILKPFGVAGTTLGDEAERVLRRCRLAAAPLRQPAAGS